MFVSGLIAGWTIENTAAAMNLITAGFVIYNTQKQQLKKWMLTGLFGTLTGFCLLLIAPGNYVRYAETNTKLIHHFLNLIAAGAELLIYVLPAILFLVLVWRILIKNHAQKQGLYIAAINNKHFTASDLLTTSVIFFLIISYINGTFFSKWLTELLYNNIAVPLGIANNHLKVQLSNTMSGFEEAVSYLLMLSLIAKLLFRTLSLRKKDLSSILPKISRKEIFRLYPECRYTAALIVLAIINHIIMIASPSFPGRAGFGSAVFLIMAAISSFNISSISAYLLDNKRKKYITILAVILILPLAAAVLHHHLILNKENNVRMDFIEKKISQGADYLELQPISIRSSLLRHVYFVDLNNSVSKYGFCRYYKLKNVKVID